jgi:DNA polymerase-4
MDTLSLLTAFESLWTQMRRDFAVPRYLQVGITLGELSAADGLQPGLFDSGSLDARTEARRLALSRAMDKVNQRFGRDAVTLGHDSAGAARSSGPRIAFTRIPELAEFHE